MTREPISWLGFGRFSAVALLIVATGCGSEQATNPITPPPSGAAGTASAPIPNGLAGATAVPPTTIGGAAGSGIINQPPTAANPPDALSGSVPCEVASVVSKNCTLCHSASVRYGAPMPLMALKDFHADAILSKGKKVYEVTPERINATDIKRRMPPASSAAVATTDLSMFSTWLQGGAKGVPNGCPITDVMAPPTTGPDTMMPGMNPTMMPSTGGMGHASIEPIEYNDPDMKCYKMLAHASGDLNKPYMKSPGQQYINFGFKAPWTTDVYSRAIKLAIDPNSKVIHHWLLFKSPTATAGSVSAGSGIHSSGDVLLHGWAPGATPIYLDPDLGMQLEADVNYLLEVHYYNETGGSSPDSSGAEICVTTKKPVNEVAVSWVGTDSIAGTSAQGTCNPRATGPIHIIAAQPHMHLKGNHMKVVVNRAGGMKETLHDMPFDFDYQKYYVLDTTLMPGDTMTTTCNYSAPSTFGSATENEMCYFFSLHWPAGTLGSSSLIHGQNTCLN
ncbi:MAG TPA: hypothetical protein VFG30_04290 [Polyangiales bacterium]|nr:hypothetical protein [Polyangiales bacterium]